MKWKILDTNSKDGNFRNQGSILLLDRQREREKASILRGNIKRDTDYQRNATSWDTRIIK